MASSKATHERILCSNYGGSIQLSSNHRCARRSTSSYNKGLVFTNHPLPKDKLLQFTVEKDQNSEWDGSLKVGVTGLPPVQACGVETATDLRHSTFVLCTSARSKKQDALTTTDFYINGKRVLTVDGIDLSLLDTRTKVGLALRKNVFHFFIDSHTHLKIELPEVILDVPVKCYGLVDLYGSCTGISDARLISLKEHQKSSSRPVELKVSEERLRECGIAQKLEEDSAFVSRHEDPVSSEQLKTSSLPVGAKHYPEVLSRHHSEGAGVSTGGDEMLVGDFSTRPTVVCSNFEDDLADLRQEYNIPKYEDNFELAERGSSSQEGSGQWGVVSAEEVVSGGDDDEDSEVDTSHLEQEYQYGAGQYRAEFQVEQAARGGHGAGLELTQEVKKGGAQKVREEVKKGGTYLPERDYNVVKDINNEPLAAGENKQVEVEVGAMVAKAIIKNVKRPGGINCSYSKLVQLYISVHDFGTKLKGYLDSEYDKCYCDSCFDCRGDTVHKSHGRPAKVYSIQRGWYKLGLKLSNKPQIDTHKSFTGWHKAYHGTPLQNVGKILDTGGIVPAGAKSFEGDFVSPGPGHYTEDSKPAGHNIHRVFLSPSIIYASKRVFTKPHSWYPDGRGGRGYEVKLCFKVLVKPKCYKMSPQTLLPPDTTEDIDELFDNSQLEWSTDQDRVVYIYALMIRIDGSLGGRES